MNGIHPYHMVVTSGEAHPQDRIAFDPDCELCRKEREASTGFDENWDWIPPEDDLSTARGLLIGTVTGALMWVVVFCICGVV